MKRDPGVAGARRKAAWRPLIALMMLAGTATAVPAQETVVGPGQLTVLDVPYIAQTPELCGGAAAAMVLRYWGRRDVRDTDFAHLVDEASRGIRTTDLVGELRRLDFEVLLPAADAMETAVDRGRPPIALIEVGPDTYHYVVVVARREGFVVYHDPATAPFQTVEWEEFDRRWQATGRWMAVAVPTTAPEPARPAEPEPESVSLPPAPCAPSVREGVRLAGVGELDAARDLLQAATLQCPESSVPWREIAGTHFVEQDWQAAARFAAVATATDAGDRHAWRLLATSRYLDGDELAALAAWNVLGEPRLDLIAAPELTRVAQPVVEKRLGLTPGMLLTPGALRLAGRRLDALPIAASSRLSYRPADEGRAELAVGMVTRPMPGFDLPTMARLGLGAVTDRHLRVRVPGPTRRGDMLEATWRWQKHRPGIAVSLATPDLAGLPGILRLEGAWDVQSYSAAGPEPLRETLQAGRVGLSRWLAAHTRVQAGFGLERWSSRDLDMVVSAAIEQRFLGDHGALEGRFAAAFPTGSATRYQAASLRTRWRTTSESAAAGLFFDAGLTVVGDDAPRGRWPGAGTGLGRDELLRAHPLIVDGIVVPGAFGRSLANGTLEARAFPWRVGALPVGVAVFVDAALAANRPDEPGTARFIDAGLGLRLAIPGGSDYLRIDWAGGLRDSASAFSIGWTKGLD